MDTLNSGGSIRLLIGGITALVQIALRSPAFSGAGLPDSPSPSFMFHHIGSIHGQALYAFEVA